MTNTLISGSVTFSEDVNVSIGSIQPAAIAGTFESNAVTSNAVPSAVIYMLDVTSDLTQNSVISINGKINGLNSTQVTKSCGGTFSAVYYFDYGQNEVFLLGTPLVNVQSGGSCTFSASNSGIYVTGIALTSFNWHVLATIMIN